MKKFFVRLISGLFVASVIVVLLFSLNIFNLQKNIFTQSQYNYKPSEGYIPDADTAVRIAEAIWLPIYGEGIYEERPFTANLKNDTWTVTGTLPEGYLGGVAEIDISKDDGKILRVIHGQ